MTGLKDKERFVFFKYVPPKAKASFDTEEQNGLIEAHEPIEAPPNLIMEPESSKDMRIEGRNEAFEDSPEQGAEPEGTAAEEEVDPNFSEEPEIPEEPECPEEPEGPCPEGAIIHVIQEGDTFWKLAKKYGTTVEEISDANPDVDPLNLQIGETLCIPVELPGAKG